MQFKQSWASRISPSVAIAVCSLLVAAASLLISWNQLNLNTIITNLQKERERVIFHGRSNWDTEEYKLGTEELLIFATRAKIFDIKLHGSLSVEYENADGQACHFSDI